MTEAEWQTYTDPKPMLASLQGRASPRKLRLFGCACCRRVWRLLTDERGRTAVEVAERFADGAASQEELTAAKQASAAAAAHDASWWERFKSQLFLDDWWWDQWIGAASWAASDASASTLQAVVAVAQATLSVDDDSRSQCHLIRDIFGNPFRRPPTINPSPLTWSDGLVRKLARAAYEDRHLPTGTFDEARLAILADALEEAGCTDADILDHFRGPGPHVRGCWVVDLLLGKE